MLEHETCKRILNEGDLQYTDEEVKQISELLMQLAELSVETYFELTQTKKDEKSYSESKSK